MDSSPVSPPPARIRVGVAGLGAVAQAVHLPQRPGLADGRTDIVTCQRIAAAWAVREGIAIGGEAAGAGA